MSERSTILAAPEAAQSPARQVPPAPALEEENALPEVFDVARVPLFGAGGIDDDDADRARRTARLLRDIVPALGLDPSRLRIVVNSSSAAATEARQAVGFELDGVIQLEPSAFDPESSQGRYLLGHELAHSAQRRVANGAANLELAEWEADEVGRAVARRERFVAPLVRLSGNSPAAADIDAPGALEDTVKVTRKREIDRIHKALKHIFWISKSDIDRALKTLTDMDFFTARAVVRSLDRKERYWLVDNLASDHYKRYRSEIFACYAALDEKQIAEFDERLLTEIDLHELSADEHHAVLYVLKHLRKESHDKLAASKNGPAIQVIEANEPDLEGLQKQQRDALQVEEERRKADDSDKSAMDGDAALRSDFEQIKERLNHFFVSDAKALDALDIAAKYTTQPDKMQALAHALDDSGSLDRLVKELPVKALFEELHANKDKAGKTISVSPRRKAFLMLVANRPPYKNVELAEELTSYGIFDWSVSEEEAYLAFQLLRGISDKSRASFMRANDGKYWERINESFPPAMRHSEAMNFYSGGKGRMDLASIETPLLDASLWTKDRISELDGRIRMAVAAGDHQFVFEESRRKEAYKLDGLKPVVDKYRLYDPAAIGPDGKPQPRTEYSGELLPTFVEESTRLSRSLIVRFSGAEAKHVSLANLQEGGDLAGVRFKTDAAVKGEEKKPGEFGGGNFLDTVVVDMGKGLITVEARVLSIESVRYLYGDMLIQSGEGRLEDIKVRAGYPKGDSKAYFMQVTAGAIVLKDILLTASGSMTAINQASIRNGSLYSASEHVDPAKQNASNEDNIFERILSGAPIFSPFLGLLRLLANKGNLKKAFTQTAEFSVSADDIELTGVTLSSGEHLDSIGLEHARFGKGEQISGYRSALEASLQDLQARINTEQEALIAVPPPPDKAAREKALQRLQEQRQRVAQELVQVQTDQAEISRLEDRQKNGKLSPEEETKLANLKRGGTAFDIETVKLKGISGRLSSGDLTLTNVHGQGRQSQFIAGSDARPVLESQADASKLTVDVGDIGLKNLVLKKSPPSAEALAAKIKRIQDDLAQKGQAADFRTAEKLAKLQDLYKKVARYEDYAKQGAANLSESQAKDFAQLRTELYEQTSRVDAEVNIEGASIDLDFSGGLGALTDLRKTLKKATLGAKSLSLKDVSIPGTGFHAEEITATNPSVVIERSNRSTSLSFNAQEILVTGLELRRTRDELEEQIRQIQSAGPPSPSAQRRLDRVQQALDDLDRLTAQAEEDGRALAASKGTFGEAKAQQKVDADVTALKKWQDKLVAQSISVKNLNVHTNIAAGLLSDELDADDDTTRLEGGFDEATITGAESGPVSAKTTTIGKTRGTVTYQPDSIQITDFGVDSIQIEGLHYSGGLVEVSSKDVTTLKGIDAEATISYEKGPGGDVLATTADIKHLGIKSIEAQNLHYEDSSGKQKLTVDVPSGALLGVSLTDFSVRIPDDPEGQIAATGALNVESVKKLKILAQVKGGLSAEGTVDASGLNVDFLKDGEQTINLKELDVSEGKVEKAGTRATFSVTKLSGQVKRKKDGTTEFEIPIDKIEVASLSWRSEGRSIVSHAPLVLSGIKVTGSMHQNQASSEKEVDRIVVSQLHVTGITGEDITYTDGDTKFRIAKTDPAQKDPATALVIDGVDLTGLTWRPKHKLTIDNLDVRHMAAAFSAEVKASAISASGVVKAERINLKLLKGGKLVAKVDDLSADIKGNVKGAAFKASIQHLKTEATADGDTVTLDPLTIESIPIKQFSFASPDFQADLNEGDGNNVTLHDLAAKIRIVLNPPPKPGAVPPGTAAPSAIKSIIFDSLVVPSTTGTGFSITLPSVGGLRLFVDKGNNLKLGKMELTSLKKDGAPFTLDHTADGWKSVGKLVLADGDIQKLGFEVGKSLKGSGALHAEGGSLTFGAGPLEYRVDRVTVDELEALSDLGAFRIVRRPGAGVELKGIKGTSEGDVSAEEGSAKGITYESDDKKAQGSLADINLPKGVRRNAKGEIFVGDNASAGGFTYDNTDWGLHLEFDKVAFPKGAKIELGKSIHTDRVDLHEAKFRIDDVMKFKKSSGGGGGGSTLLNTNFLDQLEGRITTHIVLDITGNPHFEWDADIGITGGGVNYETIHGQFPFLLKKFVLLQYDDGSGNFRVVKRNLTSANETIKEAEVPAAERPAADNEKRVQLKLFLELHDPPGPAGTPSHLNQLHLTNSHANLHLNNPAVIELTDGGVITIQTKGTKGQLAFHEEGDILAGDTPAASTLKMGLDNLDAKVEHLKLGGGKEVNAASIAIEQIKDVQLGMTGFTPGKLEGTIVNGSADNLDLILGAPAAKKATP